MLRLLNYNCGLGLTVAASDNEPRRHTALRLYRCIHHRCVDNDDNNDKSNGKNDRILIFSPTSISRLFLKYLQFR